MRERRILGRRVGERVKLYTNLDGTTPDKKLVDVLRWQAQRIARRFRERQVHHETPRRDNDGSALHERSPHLTWIGHATFVMRLGEKLVATDPVWSERLHVVRRRSRPGVELAKVPRLDLVTISHAHYDHLDLPTLLRIGPRATYVVPTDVGPILRRAGLPNVVELGWWETYRDGGLSVTLVPAQHWSMRTPWDRNRSLWGGFVFESDEGVAYHAGDTAFDEGVFRAIAERFPRIDWAMLPIGAYEPSWMMQPQHMGPEEAGRAFELLSAAALCSMHWGTFALTDEPHGEPPVRARAYFERQGHDLAKLWVFDLGETRRLRG